MPVTDSLDEFNDRLRRWDSRDEPDHREDHYRRARLRVRPAALAPLPADRFDPGLVLTSARRPVEHGHGPDGPLLRPGRLIGRQVRVSLRPSELVVFDGRTPVARHERVVARGGESIHLDHYFEVLRHKPGALKGSTALAAAREVGVFTASHEAFWAESRKVNGDSAGTRELIRVLPLHRTISTMDVRVGIHAALTVGAVTADVVAVEARLAASTDGFESDRHHIAHDPTLEPRVVSLTQSRLRDP